MPLDYLRDRFPTEPEVDLGGKSARQYMDAYDTRNISYGSPYDQKDLGKVGQGLSDAYMSSIMELPMMAMEYLMPDDPYEAGVLQSGPQDRMREGEFKWQEHMKGQSQDPSYATGQDFGQALGVVADPFIDAPLMGIPALGKMMKLSPDTTAKMGSGVMGRLMDETGSIVAQQGDEAARLQRAKDMGFNPDLTLYHGSADEITEFDPAWSEMTTGNNPHGGFFFADEVDVAEDYSRQAFNRRYQDNPEGLVDDNIITQERFDEIDNAEGDESWYEYVDELANEQLKKHPSHLKMENPLVMDWHGERIDLEKADSMANFVKNGVDETGEFSDEMAEMYKYNEDDIADNLDEIKEYAVEEHGLDSVDELEDWMVDDAKFQWMDENGFEPDVTPYDGIIHRNVVDDISFQSAIPHNQYVVFDPSQIRSTKAEFNPWSSQSGNVMASGALGTMGYAASKGRE